MEIHFVVLSHVAVLGAFVMILRLGWREVYKFQYPSNSVNPHLKIALSNPQSVSSSTVWSVFHAVLILWWQLPTFPNETKLQVTKSQQCLKKLRLFKEIVIALIVCHKEQVYHGDLKGTNILLDRCLVTIYKERNGCQLSARAWSQNYPLVKPLECSLSWTKCAKIRGQNQFDWPIAARTKRNCGGSSK